MKGFSRTDLLVVVAAAVVLAADQITKAWAIRAFSDGPVHVIWTLELVLAHNTGAAFSLLSGKGVGPLLALVAVVIVALVVRSMRGIGGRFTSLAVGMVVGGALGNLADRAFRSDEGFMHGAVVDWINFQWWPVFNLADACIVVGAIILGFRVAFAPEPLPQTTTGKGTEAGSSDDVEPRDAPSQKPDSDT